MHVDELDLPTQIITIKQFHLQPRRYQGLAQTKPLILASHGDPFLVLVSVQDFIHFREARRLIGPGWRRAEVHA